MTSVADFIRFTRERAGLPPLSPRILRKATAMPGLTRSHPIFAPRHYEVVAAVLRGRVDQATSNGVNFLWRLPALEEVARDFCTTFRTDNPNFKRPRFMKACGLPEGA